MKKVIVAFIAVALAIIPVNVYALDIYRDACNTGGAGGSAVCQEKGKGGTNPLAGPNGELRHIAQIVAGVAGFAAIVALIYGGWVYVTAQGDAAKIAQAKNAIIYAVVGLVVIAVADSIVSIVLSRL